MKLLKIVSVCFSDADNTKHTIQIGETTKIRIAAQQSCNRATLDRKQTKPLQGQMRSFYLALNCLMLNHINPK